MQLSLTFNGKSCDVSLNKFTGKRLASNEADFLSIYCENCISGELLEKAFGVF